MRPEVKGVLQYMIPTTPKVEGVRRRNLWRTADFPMEGVLGGGAQRQEDWLTGHTAVDQGPNGADGEMGGVAKKVN